MKKKFLLVSLCVIFVLSMVAMAACNTTSVDGTYYYGSNGTVRKDDYYVLKGNTWTDNGGSSGEYELDGDKITLYINFLGAKTEYMSGTLSDGVLSLEVMGGVVRNYYKDGEIKDAPVIENKITVTFDANGGAFGSGSTITQSVDAGSLLTAPEQPTRTNYAFGGWSKTKSSSDLWDFANNKVDQSTTLYAVWKEESARIFSVEGAKISNYDIYLVVDHETDSVSLSNKVVCSDDSTWKLYYDKLGQMEIPTKVVASQSGALVNGSNTFYMVVTNRDGTQTNLYTLEVYRSFAVNVTYMANSKVVQTATAWTGYEYTLDYEPTLEGYTFNYWQNSEGQKVENVTPTSAVMLTADVTANKYNCNLDVDGGNELDETEYELTFDKQFELPIPTRKGHTFLGWYADDVQLTSANGSGVGVWNIAAETTATAKWQINKYNVNLSKNYDEAGSVYGSGAYNFGSSVTITASVSNGYNFLGWYSGGTLITEDSRYTFTLQDQNVYYTAKYNYYTVTTSRNDSSAGTVTAYNNTKVSVGQSVTITATTNAGYTFVGWFRGGNKLTSELAYTFTMSDSNATYTARWSKVTLDRNNASAGTVGNLTGKYKVGDEVTITAITNAGYTFVGWFNGDNKLTDELEYTFTMSETNVTYTAQWSKVTLEINNYYAGTISALTGKYKVGDEVTISADTNAGFSWVGWFLNEEQLTTDLSYTFSMSNENVTYTAKWTVNMPYIDNNGILTHYTKDDIKVITSGISQSLSGWYVLSGTISGSFTFTVRGEAHIILADDCCWEMTMIEAVGTNVLHLYAQSQGTGEGQLVVSKNIGGTNSSINNKNGGNCGTIEINGGNISAANIGGGNTIYDDGTAGNGGTIIINGGNITATNLGAGRGGSGDYGSRGKNYGSYGSNGGTGETGGDGGNGGLIIINGGEISVTNIGGGDGGTGGEGGRGGDSDTGRGGNGGTGGRGGDGGTGGVIIFNGGNLKATRIGAGSGGQGGRGGDPGNGPGGSNAGNRGYQGAWGSNGTKGADGSIYFQGSELEWNACVPKAVFAKVYFYSEYSPTESGNYWHYADDGETPVIWVNNKEE